MSFAPRDTPARRRRLVQGRARMAVLVASATALGGVAGAGLPALAGGSASPACDDPARTTPTVIVAGQVIDCAPPADTTRATPVVPDPPVAPDPPADVAPPDPPADPDPPAGHDPPATLDPPADPNPPADPHPGPAEDPREGPTAAAAGDGPARQVAEPTGPAADAPSGGPVAPTPAARPAVTADGGEAVTIVKPHGGGRPARTDNGRTHRPHTPRVRTKKTAHKREAEQAGPGAASDPAGGYATLPARWTSLDPIVLPAFGVGDFPIPPFLLPIYQAAAAQYGLPWEVLAAINEIETDFGRNTAVSSAGALGWMQFIPSSWARYGVDGDGDHRRDPRHPVDAIFAAARYLKAAGGQTDLPKAIFAYNHAQWYVDRVVERAREFAGLDHALVAALSKRALREDHVLYRAKADPFAGSAAVAPSAGQALLLTKRQLIALTLHSPDIQIYPDGRRDIAAGHIDRRVLATLVFLARSGLKPTVSSLVSGHSRLTTSGNVSAHSYGHAVDIAQINGTPILGHQGAGSITATTLNKLVELQGYLEPNQIITLMTIAGHANTLAMGDHDDHIHVGFPRMAALLPGANRPADVRRVAATIVNR
ncbi:MAG: peptidoglycan DD-metalloendopeptidase family protein [Solirubrobacterales bacterium]|nr:peptidoglycan DD-metalloendopeptidase family protein [Solirubrobacterales bacterium]